MKSSSAGWDVSTNGEKILTRSFSCFGSALKAFTAKAASAVSGSIAHGSHWNAALPAFAAIIISTIQPQNNGLEHTAVQF